MNGPNEYEDETLLVPRIDLVAQLGASRGDVGDRLKTAGGGAHVALVKVGSGGKLIECASGAVGPASERVFNFM